jgi:riboflavin synthase
MFTGIVQDVGRVQAREERGGDVRLTIAADRLDLSRTAIGDSICVQGCCVTVIELEGNIFRADLSLETLSLTTLGELKPRSLVNLEPALRAGDPLGGHLVSGHVDGVGDVVERSSDARSLRLRIAVPPALSPYIARKGSICIDGVSLTVNDVDGAIFGVNLIPHTQTVTTLGRLRLKERVNLEIDQVARYVERLMSAFTGIHER